MSERQKLDNAYHKGKKAYWDKIPVENNPMRAGDSRTFWTLGWRKSEQDAALPQPTTIKERVF